MLTHSHRYTGRKCKRSHMKYISRAMIMQTKIRLRTLNSRRRGAGDEFGRQVLILEVGWGWDWGRVDAS